MDLVHVKLKTGEDLVGYLENRLDSSIRVNSPVQMTVDPNFGFFAKSWLLLSQENSVHLKLEDLYFCHKASDKAERYYDEFMHRIHQDDRPTDLEFDSELEDIFTAMVEAKSSLKH